MTFYYFPYSYFSKNPVFNFKKPFKPTQIKAGLLQSKSVFSIIPSAKKTLDISYNRLI